MNTAGTNDRRDDGQTHQDYDLQSRLLASIAHALVSFRALLLSFYLSWQLFLMLETKRQRAVVDASLEALCVSAVCRHGTQGRLISDDDLSLILCWQWLSEYCTGY